MTQQLKSVLYLCNLSLVSYDRSFTKKKKNILDKIIYRDWQIVGLLLFRVLTGTRLKKGNSHFTTVWLVKSERLAFRAPIRESDPTCLYQDLRSTPRTKRKLCATNQPESLAGFFDRCNKLQDRLQESSKASGYDIPSFACLPYDTILS